MSITCQEIDDYILLKEGEQGISSESLMDLVS